MKRPEKKEIKAYTPNDPDRAYNQGRQDMIDFQPSVDELEQIITEFVTNKSTEYQIIDTDGETKTREMENGSHIRVSDLAQAIFKRNGGK